MINANILLTVKDSADVPMIRDCLAEQGRLSRAEPGCAVRGLSLAGRSDALLVVERRESQEALDMHRKAKRTPRSTSRKCCPA